MSPPVARSTLLTLCLFVLWACHGPPSVSGDAGQRLGSTVWGPASSGGSGFPSQTGNANKFLKTDGATASWATPVAFTMVLDNVAGSASNWTGSFTPSRSGLVRIDVAAGGISNNQKLTANLTIDSTVVKSVSTFVNTNQHATLPPLFYSTTLSIAAHTLAITITGTSSSSDSNDSASMMVSEF